MSESGSPLPSGRGAVSGAIPSFPLISRAPDDVVFRLPGEAITTAMLLDAAHRLADILPDGAYVANLCRDRLWFAVALVAAMLREEITLLTSDRSPARLRALAEDYPRLYLLTDEQLRGMPLDQHLLARSPLPVVRDAPATPSVSAAQVAAIVFTSGSTGQPLAHRKLWGALVERSDDAASRFGFTRSHPPSIVGMVPPQHMYGFETTVLLPMHAPATAWCGPAFYPQDVAAALRAVPEPRVLVTTPLQIRALLRASAKLATIDQVVSATAPLFGEMAEAAERRWKTQVFEIFGATEVGSIASRRTVADDVWHTYPRVRLSRDDAHAGRVSVHGPFAEPCAVNDVITYLDDQHFRLVGRAADMVKLGGRRASLAELTRILTEIEGVSDGQFIAPEDLDRRPTARLVAFAVAPQRTADEILSVLRSRIDPLFLPRRIILVDQLPRNDVGKLTDQALGILRTQIAGD